VVVGLISGTESVAVIAPVVQHLNLELQLCSIIFYVYVLQFLRKTLLQCTIDKHP
jgi:energy-converting hydrogenase Eha subunit E